MTQVNGRPIDPWIAFSVDYARFLNSGNAADQRMSTQAALTPKPNSQSDAKSKDWWGNHKSQFAIGRVTLAFFASGAGKKICVVIVAVLAAIGTRLGMRNSSRSATTLNSAETGSS
jgi:hypothetical protein